MTELLAELATAQASIERAVRLAEALKAQYPDHAEIRRAVDAFIESALTQSA